MSVAWQIDAYRFEMPVLAAPMDSVVSPATAIEIGRLGGLGVLDLEGLWTRYEDPEPLLAEIAGLDDAEADPADAGGLRRRRSGRTWSRAGSPRSARPGSPSLRRLSPQRTAQLWKTVVDAGVDMFVIRGTTVSAPSTCPARRSR